MNSRDFRFWLHGFFEIRDGKQPLSARQVTIIRRHLALVKLISGYGAFEAWLDKIIGSAVGNVPLTQRIDDVLNALYHKVT